MRANRRRNVALAFGVLGVFVGFLASQSRFAEIVESRIGSWEGEYALFWLFLGGPAAIVLGILLGFIGFRVARIWGVLIGASLGAFIGGILPAFLFQLSSPPPPSHFP